jgi:hypothetical protein
MAVGFDVGVGVAVGLGAGVRVGEGTVAGACVGAGVGLGRGLGEGAGDEEENADGLDPPALWKPTGAEPVSVGTTPKIHSTSASARTAAGRNSSRSLRSMMTPVVGWSRAVVALILTTRLAYSRATCGPLNEDGAGILLSATHQVPAGGTDVP